MEKEVVRVILTNNKKSQHYFCPYCNKTVVSQVLDLFQDKNITLNKDVHYVLECPSCGRPTIYNCIEQTTSPLGKELRPVAHLPEDIEKLYEEVRTNIAAGCYTSAVILARTILAYVAVDKGAEPNEKFVEYVGYLDSNKCTPPDSKAWVDSIRKMGNEAIHQLEIKKKEDACLIGNFLMYLLIFIYELPSSLNKYTEGGKI